MEGVRRAEHADLGRCRELVAEAVGASAGQRGATLLLAAAGAAPDELVEHWHGDEDTVLLVGTYDEATVGVAAGSIASSGGHRLGRVECCYVEPDARAVGVGSALVATLVTWFTERRCDGVDALALPGDRSTKQLLEAAGFKARLLVLHRSLG